MHYSDRVYSEIEIADPAALDLIAGPSLQRLRGVDQAGYSQIHFPGTAYSRFEHSVGVYVLLVRYGAPRAEQIAGLIHDVSHSAFSHVIDYVLDEGSEREHNHQDNVFETFVRQSEIPAILERYHLDLAYILNDDHFPLKERPLPDLCADRLDYSLRSTVAFREINIDDVRYFLEHLEAKNSSWVFKDFDGAKRYAELFRVLNAKYYAGLPSAVMFYTTGAYLRHALNHGYLTKNDLYTTDAAVLEKIEPHLAMDEMLRLLSDRMNGRVAYANNPNDYDAHVFCKSRIVDPLCTYGDAVKRVSEIDPGWATVVQQESRPKEYFIKFER